MVEQALLPVPGKIVDQRGLHYRGVVEKINYASPANYGAVWKIKRAELELCLRQKIVHADEQEKLNLDKLIARQKMIPARNTQKAFWLQILLHTLDGVIDEIEQSHVI